MVIAYHIILTGYGHWLPNDLRGSLSRELRQSKLAPFGEIHFGRKAIQPNRDALKAFLKAAQSVLQHRIVWFDGAKRQAIAQAFAEVVRRERYTCFACAIMSNHAHLIVRKHRDNAERMIEHFCRASAAAIRGFCDVASDHPVWSRDEYKRFIDSVAYLERGIEYVQENPGKSNLPDQHFEFVRPYRGEWRR